MGTLIMPEVELFKIVLSCVNFIKYQCSDNSINEEETFLYALLNQYKDGKIDFYKEAKSIFSRKGSHDRNLTVRQSFNIEKINNPCLIVYSGKETLSESNSLGYGEGDFSPIEYTDGSGAVESLNRRYNCSGYSVAVLSDSELEVILIEYVVRSLLVSNVMTFQKNCLQNLQVESSEMMFASDEFDTKTKSLDLSFFYEMKVPLVKGFKYINSIEVDGTFYLK